MKRSTYCITLFLYSYKILENVNLPPVTERRSAVAADGKNGKGMRGDYKGGQNTFGSDGHVYCLDYSEDFYGCIYLCQKSSDWTF